MKQIVAAALMACCVGFLFAIADTHDRDPNSYRVQLHVGIGMVAFFSAIWAVESAHGLSGAIILIFTPIGVACVASAAGTYARVTFAPGKWRTIAISVCLIGFIVAWVIGFPPHEDDF